MNPILVYIACKDVKEAKKISEKLLQTRLIACSNIIPKIDSLYWWQDKIKAEQETVLLCKSFEKNFEEITKKVKQLHSYDIPAILAIPLKLVESDYLNWLKKETD